MINLIPDKIKSDRKYARLNILIARHLSGLALIAVLAVGFMISGVQLMRTDEAEVKEKLAVKEAEYEPLKQYEDEAKELNAEVKTIQSLFAREVKFSELLVSIASSIPTGSRLTSLSLTGGSTAPINISARVPSQEGAAVLRKSLVESDIFEAADINNISTGDTTDAGVVINYEAELTVTLTGSAEAIRQQKAAEEAEAKAEASAAETGAQGG